MGVEGWEGFVEPVRVVGEDADEEDVLFAEFGVDAGRVGVEAGGGGGGS